MPITRRTTVTRKPQPHPTATTSRSRLLMAVRAEKPGRECSISEVMSRIIAVTASHRLISAKVNGKINFPTSNIVEYGLNSTGIG